MQLTGAEIIIEDLCEAGVDTVFGYPGGYVLNIYDELYKNSHRIKHYITCHEQGAAHAADGYARRTGKPGVVIATSGPGATNLVTGIACAYFDSTPLVAITGNVPVAMLGRDSFQEVDIAGVTMPITKHNYIVKDVSDLARTVREAFTVAISGRPGPVLIDVPKDVQLSRCEFTPAEKPKRRPNPTVRKAAIERAAVAIASAKRPFIYYGGGIIIDDAVMALKSFAEKIDAPIACSMMGLTAVEKDYPRFLGMLGMHGRYAAVKALDESDVIIAAGVRFSDRATGDKARFSAGKTVIHIDIDAAEISKNIKADIDIIGSVREVLELLCDAVPSMQHPEWAARVAEIKASVENDISMGDDTLTPQYAIEKACAMLDKGEAVVTDVGQHQMWTTLYGTFNGPRTFLSSGGLGAMGFGMGASIGASVGGASITSKATNDSCGGRRTLLITSDGSFHMNMNELATAVTYNLPIKVLILNNNVLGMVRQWQTLFFNKRYSQTTLDRKTDYVKLAESFGALGVRAATREELDKAVRLAFETPGPFVIDCVIDSDECVLPMIPAGRGIDDIILRHAESEINKGK